MTNEELNALIAEKVMGWTKRVSADHTGTRLAFLGIIYAWRDEKGREMGLDVPHYSTDISAAWLVVEKLSPSYDVSVHHFLGRTWQCTLEHRDGKVRFAIDLPHPGDAHGNAPTPAHAICLAALDAALLGRAAVGEGEGNA